MYERPLTALFGHWALFCNDFYSFCAAGHALTALSGRFSFHQQLAFTAP
jgi:hypothetical protein